MGNLSLRLYILRIYHNCSGTKTVAIYQEWRINMPDAKKYDKILDALSELLSDQNIQNISVSDIARKAGIGKGSIYYYFPSKEAILDALIQRSYKKPLQTAKNLANQTEISPFTRMAMIFQACHNSSAAFLNQNNSAKNAITSAIIIILLIKLGENSS